MRAPLVPFVVALAAGTCAALPPAAQADVLLPPAGRAFTGLTGSNSTALFSSQVGKGPAVFGFFTYWNAPWEYIFRSARSAGSRVMLHVSTAQNYGQPERVTPLGIARGRGDSYLVALNARIAEHGEPTYVRLMAEMNQANNAYSAFNANGSSRGPSHSTAAFRRARQRSTLILRGGPVAAIDARLARLGLPSVRGVGSSASLPRPKVALLWVPQTRGSPDIPANMPRAYWPGGEYVDWVGTDFYSRFPRFDWLEQFYKAFPGKPFVFGEWALWGADDPGFVRRLFAWMRAHPRVRMQLYNQGQNPAGPFRLRRYPRARRALSAELRATRWLARAPELAR